MWCCSSVTKSCPTHCDPTDCSMPGFPVPHHLLEFVQVHIHWIGDAISSSAFLFSFCLQFFPELGSYPLNWLFASGGQGIGASVSASVLPMSIQGWFPLGFTGLISLLSKGLSRVFSNTTVQKPQFFGTQPSSWSNSHLHTILSYTARNGLMEAQRGGVWLWASGKSPSEMCWIWNGEKEFLE